MSVIISSTDMKKVMDLMKVKVPSEIQKSAMDAVAVTAAEGRKVEQKTANGLRMGMYQYTTSGKDSKTPKQGVFSKWTAAGWASTSRRDGKGNPYRMASFTWERARRNGAGAFYTNQLANLWANQTKPYSATSPLVGSEGRMRRWRKGKSRPSRYDWSATERAIAAAVEKGVAEAERRLSSRLAKD